MSDNLRTIEVLRDGAWVRARLAEIKKGERFRYTEDGREHFYTAAGDGQWCTLDAPYEMNIQALLEKRNSMILIEESGSV